MQVNKKKKSQDKGKILEIDSVNSLERARVKKDWFENVIWYNNELNKNN